MFDSQYQHNSSQPSVKPSPEDILPFSGLHGICLCVTHRYTFKERLHTHINLMSKRIKNSKVISRL